MDFEPQKQHENMDVFDMIKHLKTLYQEQARHERVRPDIVRDIVDDEIVEYVPTKSPQESTEKVKLFSPPCASFCSEIQNRSKTNRSLVLKLKEFLRDVGLGAKGSKSPKFSIRKTCRKSPIQNSKTLEVPAREERVIKNYNNIETLYANGIKGCIKVIADPEYNEGKPNHNGFAAVFEKIESVIKALPQDNMKFATIMIDDISFLQVAANGSSNDVLDFLHYCYTLTSEYGCAFIALDHKDIYLNEEKPAIILEMEYLADILVKAEPLATGLAKDVHGQLMVLHKQTQHGIAPVKIHNFHYKIKENSIECFYPGTKI
ncbi:paxneb protein [Medicago truncatula]|uniref:Paxneb protein n=1 Tax=Medicago truncatula TaxID=3880 RepID=A0A072TYJ7_MEDTR|nr:paxneb protein [Medicago truncatula]